MPLYYLHTASPHRASGTPIGVLTSSLKIAALSEQYPLFNGLKSTPPITNLPKKNTVFFFYFFFSIKPTQKSLMCPGFKKPSGQRQQQQQSQPQIMENDELYKAQVDVNDDKAPNNEQEQVVNDLPSYNDATEGQDVPLLKDEKAEVHQPQETQPPKYQKQEGIEESELTNDYSTGLFDCFSDPKSTALACFCPCGTSGHINSTLAAADSQYDEENGIFREPKWYNKVLHSLPYTVLAFCGPAFCVETAGLLQRYAVRTQYGLERHLVRDCMSHVFCHCCALAQDHREINIREDQRRAEFARMQQEYQV